MDRSELENILSIYEESIHRVDAEKMTLKIKIIIHKVGYISIEKVEVEEVE